jgi:hypothetical protein
MAAWYNLREELKMLPMERVELAIYRRIKSQSHSAVPISVTVQMFVTDAVHDQNAVAEALLGLEADERIRLSKVVGNLVYKYEELDEALPAELDLKRNFIWGTGLLIRITPKGRKYFQELEQCDEQEHREPLVFVSCGQSDEEKNLGKGLEEIINKLAPGYKGYFAENQSSLKALSDHIFRALDQCAGLVAVMHHRGEVETPKGKHIRGSVWVEQEIAVAAFITTTRRDIPIVSYVQTESSLRV